MQRIRTGWSYSTRSDCAYRPSISINYHEYGQEAKNLYGIKPWIIRNLLNCKNCLMKCIYFKDHESIFKKLFGASNIKLTMSDKGCCVISINDKAVEKAKLLIY